MGRWKGLVILAGALAAGCLLFLTTCTGTDRRTKEPPSPPAQWIARLPMPTDYFVENVGQIGNGEVL